MEIKLNLVELLLVVLALFLGGICLGIYFKNGNQTLLIVSGISLLSAGSIILRKRTRVKK